MRNPCVFLYYSCNYIGWEFIIYDPYSYYVPALIKKITNRFSDISNDHTNFTLKWWGSIANIYAGTISTITEIILGNTNQISKVIQKYITIMGPNCAIICYHEINGTTIYNNIYATCYQIYYNVIDVSHTICFYTMSMHMYSRLRDDRRLEYLYMHLIVKIIDTKLHSMSTLPLLCLVTHICHIFRSKATFAAYERDRVLLGSNTLSCL